MQGNFVCVCHRVICLSDYTYTLIQMNTVLSFVMRRFLFVVILEVFDKPLANQTNSQHNK